VGEVLDSQVLAALGFKPTSWMVEADVCIPADARAIYMLNLGRHVM
jgi:hypothetical protein